MYPKACGIGSIDLPVEICKREKVHVRGIGKDRQRALEDNRQLYYDANGKKSKNIVAMIQRKWTRLTDDTAVNGIAKVDVILAQK